uniref:Uncharacterized protein n=1 Tax=Clastoptera arizonana TaxID=38151 RepID=A0A1B6CDC5_9HEMI
MELQKNKEIVESPLKRLQPSRLTKNTSTCKKTENASKNKTPSKDTNNETLPSTPRRISLWKPCNSPNHRQLSTIDENGKENILLKKEDSECPPAVKRTRRRSVSASNTNDVNIEPRITRRSLRSQSESILCVQSPLPEIKEVPKPECLQFNNVVNKQIDAIATSPNITKNNINNFCGKKM